MLPQKTVTNVVEFGPTTYTEEAQRMQERALGGETVVVQLGPVVFFCANLEAWMLDPADRFARCLVRSGQKEPLGISETPTRFQVECVLGQPIYRP